ncbi:unnamed protein product [Sphagnum balticum]
MSDGAAEIAAAAAEEQLHFRRSISKDPSSSWWKNSAVGQFRRSFSASAKEFTSTLASKMDLAGFTLPWHQQAAGSLHHHKQQQQPKVDDRLPSSSSFNLLPWKYAAASATTKGQRKSFELPKPSAVVQEQQQLHPIPPAPLKSGMIGSSSKVAEFRRTRKQTLAQDTTAAASCKTKQMLMKDAAAAAVESATTLSSLDADIKHVNEVSLILSEAHGSLINDSSLAQALPCPPGVNRSVVDVTGSSCSGQQEAAEHEVKKSTTTQHDDSTNNFLESSAIQNMGDNILSGNPTHCTQLLPIQLQKSSSTSSDYRSHSHRKALANSLLFDESQYNSSSSFDANSLSKNHHELVGGSMRVVRDFNSYDGAQLEFIISDHPTAGPPTSLPTSPRRRRAGSAIRSSSSWLQRLRLVAGGKQQGSASSSSSHREGIGQTVNGSDNSNSGKQDATTTPVVVVAAAATTPVVVAAAAAAEERLDLRHGKKKEVSNSAPKAAHDCVTTDESTVVDDDLVHWQHEADDRNNVEIAEGNHEEEHHSFQTHEEQCCSTTKVSSMVSALLMAWLMENNTSPPHVRAAENWHLVPVVNIARQSMHNHKDAAWLFDACGVDAHALVFADELAGILLDTKNLDLASKRDIDMATTLLVGSGSLGRNGFYKQWQSGGEEPEPDHSERSEKDLYFSSTDGHHSNEQTSTSEAGTRSSSLDGEDSLQLQTPPVPTTTFLPTKIIAAPLSALARIHLPSPSGIRSTEANADKAQKQQAPGANQSLPSSSSSSSSQHLKSKSFSRIRKTLLYSA